MAFLHARAADLLADDRQHLLWDTIHQEKRLVNTIVEGARGIAAKNLVDTQAYLAIKDMIAGKCDYLPTGKHVANLERGLTHAHAETFRLIAACHHTAVVIAKHHDGFPLERRVDAALAAHEEIVAVGQSYHQSSIEYIPFLREMCPSLQRKERVSESTFGAAGTFFSRILTSEDPWLLRNSSTRAITYSGSS